MVVLPGFDAVGEGLGMHGVLTRWKFRRVMEAVRFLGGIYRVV